MSKIKLLDQNLINQIAAGEVIERPVSVVKELVENSLDAGATEIIIEVAAGGKTLIKITDNGEGLSKEDLPLALERHATSKIKTQEDLFKISTLGFRGEALSSIAAVSRFSIVSKVRDSQELNGYKLLLTDSKIKSLEPVPSNPGTTIEVTDLFYNIPARLKFLKSPETELVHIQSFISRIMLSRPDVAYTFFSEGKKLLQTQGAIGDADLTLRNAVGSVFGFSVAKNLRAVNLNLTDFSISGFISEPTVLSSNRQNQMFFVNNRNIVSPILNKAVDAAVSDIVPRGKYPYLVLFIDLAYDQVDVNVHPAKKEVRFADSGRVFEAVKSAVKNAYAKTVFLQDNGIKEFTGGFSTTDQQYRTVFNPEPVTFDFNNFSREVFVKDATPVQSVNYDGGPGSSLSVLGQANRLFIVVLDGEDLLLVDQHAAHERILYEELKANSGQKQNTQSLLIPENIELDQMQRQALTEKGQLLRELGFEWEEFSATSIVLRAVPLLTTKVALTAVFRELLAELGQHSAGTVLDTLKEKFLATLACKAAVKDGDILDRREMSRLITDLWSTPNFQTCPHGRPTVISLDKAELKKKFLRH